MNGNLPKEDQGSTGSQLQRRLILAQYENMTGADIDNYMHSLDDGQKDYLVEEVLHTMQKVSEQIEKENNCEE